MILSGNCPFREKRIDHCSELTILCICMTYNINFCYKNGKYKVNLQTMLNFYNKTECCKTLFSFREDNVYSEYKKRIDDNEKTFSTYIYCRTSSVVIYFIFKKLSQ